MPMSVKFKANLKSQRQKKAFRNHLLTVDPHCYYCRKGLCEATATLDHFLPKLHYPELRHSRDNLVLACVDCNRCKSARSAEEFFAELTERIEAKEAERQELIEVMVGGYG